MPTLSVVAMEAGRFMRMANLQKRRLHAGVACAGGPRTGITCTGSVLQRPSPFCRGLGATIAAGLLLVALVGCTRPGTKLADQSANCGVPSPIDPAVRYPTAGPLVFHGAAGLQTHAVVNDFLPYEPTKVSISLLHPLAAPVELRGWDCTTGQPLRLWYHLDGSVLFPNLTYDHRRVTTAQLASSGDLVATLPPTSGEGYPGYMLFTHAGRWKVTVAQGGRTLGAAVLQVIDARDPNPTPLTVRTYHRMPARAQVFGHLSERPDKSGSSAYISRSRRSWSRSM
jgi:hypothetical protein